MLFAPSRCRQSASFPRPEREEKHRRHPFRPKRGGQDHNTTGEGGKKPEPGGTSLIPPRRRRNRGSRPPSYKQSNPLRSKNVGEKKGKKRFSCAVFYADAEREKGSREPCAFSFVWTKKEERDVADPKPALERRGGGNKPLPSNWKSVGKGESWTV